METERVPAVAESVTGESAAESRSVKSSSGSGSFTWNLSVA